VDTIIKDLVEVSINLTKKKEREKLKSKVEPLVEEKLLDLLLVGQKPTETQVVT
jgi:ATP-dependent HslUV protease ATP-binding subunit HslU